MFEQVKQSFQFYGYAVIQILIEPRRFFTELSGKTTMIRSLGFCLLCSIFFVSASLLTGGYPNPVKMGLIFLFNSMGMVFISAGLSYMVMVMTLGRKVDFGMIFSVFAFSSGIVLLMSWMSFFFWFTEPWKWWLVYTGFKQSCNFSWKAALLNLVLTMTIQFFFLYSLYLAFYRG
ncbi:MAG: hypothetical protein KKC20_23005 [Proteobacteria bacterium]|nr:hypothetical protein [Pseudomonadota bacterium]